MSSARRPKWLRFAKGFGIWLAVTVLVSAVVLSEQYLVLESSFKSQVEQVKNRVEAGDQKINVLLQATASIYQTELNDDAYGFSVFSRSMIEHLPYVKLLGVAKNENSKALPTFIHWMQQQGYESFDLICGHWFQDELCPIRWTNPLMPSELSVMPVVQLEPFTPENAIFLGQNLLSLPGVKATLADTLRQNRAQMLLLKGKPDSALQKQRLLLIYHGFYRPSMEPLTSEERLKHVRGVVFVLLDIKTIIADIQSMFTGFKDVLIKVDFMQNTTGSQIDDVHDRIDVHAAFNLRDFNVLARYEFHKPLSWQDINYWALLSFLLLSWWLLAIVAGLYYQLRLHAAQLETQKLRMAKVFETSHDAVVVLNQYGEILDWNPEAEYFFGQMTGNQTFKLRPLLDIFTPGAESGKSITNILDWLGIRLQDGEKSHIQTTVHNQNHQQLILDIACSVIEVHDGYEISLFMRDQTEQHHAQEKVKHLAYYDSLTHLKNRVSFEQAMRELMDERIRFSILFFDLDGFKQINDALGHSIGDELLKVLGRRLIHWKKEHATVNALSRFGGDEFVILVEETDHFAVRHLANDLLALIANRVHVFHHDIHISASLGIASFPKDGDSINTLFKRADIAMYDAKALGANRFSFYESRLEQALTRDLQIQRNLRNALKRKEFYLVYQPKTNLQTGRIEGVEALLRWHNAELGTVAPDEFIPVVEKTHQLSSIGDWVIKEVLRQMVVWQKRLPEIQNVAINVSSVQLQQPRFVEKMVRLLRKTGLSSHLIELELTERIVMSNTQLHLERMKEIRDAELGLSVDDFGTGYSSLSYLKNLPLNTLKIDKSFVDGLPEDKDDVAIATAIVEMAHSLGLKVVAEGVEHAEQLQFLKGLGCDYVQGYFTGKPMSVADLEQAVKRQIGN